MGLGGYADLRVPSFVHTTLHTMHTILHTIFGHSVQLKSWFIRGFRGTAHYAHHFINHTCKVITKKSRPKMDGFNYFRYSPRPEGGSLGYSSSSKLSNGPLRPERWSLVYSTFSSTSLSISFLACAEGRAA